jgi:hypothetical protein
MLLAEQCHDLDNEAETMATDYSEKRFRSDFKAERDRILAAIRECEELDTTLNSTVTDLRASMNRNRGAASLVVRMTEQIISNRNLRLALIKELRALKKDVIEREIKLAEKTDAAGAVAGATGITAALLAHLQGVLLVPGATASVLEPAHEKNDPAVPEPEAPAEEEEGLPDELRVGDIVCDPDGNLWVLGEEGAEETALRAKEHFPDPEDGTVPYAILEDGRTVLLVDIG